MCKYTANSMIAKILKASVFYLYVPGNLPGKLIQLLLEFLLRRSFYGHAVVIVRTSGVCQVGIAVAIEPHIVHYDIPTEIHRFTDKDLFALLGRRWRCLTVAGTCSSNQEHYQPYDG